MSTPAGWYDDGSGRQRWWDGTQWTDHFAPAQPEATPEAPAAASTPDSPTEQYAPYAPPVAQTAAYPGLVGVQQNEPVEKKTPIVGYIALGLAVVGTILVFFQPILSIFGFFLLFVALVMSIIGFFIKGTAKWPSIAGVILSVVGGIIGVIMFFVFTFATYQEFIDNRPVPTTSSSEAPSDGASTAPSDEPTDAAPSGDRPTTPEVEAGLAAILADTGSEDVYTSEQLTCTAQFLVDSDIPDDKLAIIAQGPDALYSDLEAASEFTEKFADSITTCLF